MRILRFLLAVLIAPLVPAVFLVASSSFLAMSVAYLGYFVFVVVGLPVMLALRYFDKLSFVSLMLAGASIGALSLLYYGNELSVRLASMGSPTSSGFYLTMLIWGAGFGGLVAGIFGVIVGPKNLRASRP